MNSWTDRHDGAPHRNATNFLPNVPLRDAANRENQAGCHVCQRRDQLAGGAAYRWPQVALRRKPLSLDFQSARAVWQN